MFTPLQKRKQRKRTDTRVAELEREMRAMRTMLKTKNEVIRAGDETHVAEGLWEDEINVAGAAVPPPKDLNTAKMPVETHNMPLDITIQRTSIPTPIPLPSEDIISRGVLSMERATQLVDLYKSSLYKHYPVVYIPGSYPAERMRAEKPTLFMAILAAAATVEDPGLSVALGAELLRAFAEKCLINSEKSLELIQALSICAAWYSPPRRYGQLKYYEYISMAATMCIEIGVGTRQPFDRRQSTPRHQPPQEQDLSIGERPSPQGVADASATTEDKRTFIAVFCLGANCAMSLRRPLMLRPTRYLRECLEHLETCPDTAPSDGTLVAWLKISILGTEVSEAFSYDDPVNAVSITEPRVQIMLKDYVRRLDEWEASVAESDFTVGLKVMYYYARMALYELALHIDHAPQDFKAPYQMGSLCVQQGAELPTKYMVDCIAECIASAHGMMDVYLATDLLTARVLPVLSAVRISFAAFILAKLCLSYVSKESRIASLMDRSSLKAESYMDRMILHVRDVIGPQGCRAPAIFLSLLFKVRQWCANPEMINQIEDEKGFSTEPDDSPPNDSQSKPLQQAGSLSEDTASTYDSPVVAVTGNVASAIAQPSTSAQTSATTDIGTFPETMELDENFFDFLDDLNFQGGGLTGLDDWAAQPSEMISMSSTIGTR